MSHIEILQKREDVRIQRLQRELNESVRRMILSCVKNDVVNSKLINSKFKRLVRKGIIRAFYFTKTGERNWTSSYLRPLDIGGNWVYFGLSI